MEAVLVFLVLPRRLPVSPNSALVLFTRAGLMVPANPCACQAAFTAATLPWGLSWRNSFKKLVLPGVSMAVLGFLGAGFALAAALGLGLARRLPVSPICDLILLISVEPIVPSFPAAAHASFTAWTLPWGFLLRNSCTNLVLPWSLVAVAML